MFPQRFSQLVLWLALAPLLPCAARADDWPQWLGPRRDGVWREDGILARFPSGGPKVVWRAPVGPGFTGPAVAGGRVYLLDRQAEPLARGREAPGKDGLAGKERVLCLDAAEGKVLWSHAYDCTYHVHYPSGPRATPTVHQGKVYTLGAMGDLHCLDAEKGTVLWRKNLPKEYNTRPPVWGYAGHPLLDGDRLFCLVGGAGSAVVAVHKDTGRELWRALTVQEIGYAPPVLVEAGGKRQLIAWHTEAVNSLDPGTGTAYWSVKFPEGDPVRPAISVATPRHEGGLLFVSSPHHGSLVLKLAADRPAARELWRGKSNELARPDGLHSLMGSPLLQGGHIYGVCNFGELRCLKAETGERVWEQPTARRKTLGATSFVVAQGDRHVLFGDTGELVLARLTPQGYEEIDRARVLEPTLTSRGREVVWSHPAFAGRCVFLRNDKEVVCLSLKA